MPYEVTASRKRPQSFDQMVGQEFIVATLKNSILQGRIAHAYLFSGPRGVGKTSAARILAKALNCERSAAPTDTPCGECSSCRAITQGNSLDVIEIDGASNTSVNDVRQIKDEVLFAPNSSRYKIYIIDEVHMLSNSAFNALLKTIEEPPPYIVFVFATTEVHKVPATIRSRCQQFNFRLISTSEIAARLRAVVDELGIAAEEGALFWVAKEAGGSLRDAYTLLDQVVSFSQDGIRAERIREKLGLVGLDQINRVGTIIAHRDKKAMLEFAAEMLDRGVSVEQFAADLSDYFRNLLFLKCGIRKQGLLGAAPEEYAPEAFESLSAGQIEKAIELLLELQRNLRSSLYQRFDLELVMSELAALRDYIDPAELRGAVLALEQALAGTRASEPVSGGARPAGTQARPADGPPEDVRSRAASGPPSLTALVEALRGEKLALSTSLSKAVSLELNEGELRLVFRHGDRFSAEQVQKDKDVVLAQAARTFGQERPPRLRVEVAKPERGPEAGAGGDPVDIVKKVFRGEIVQGE